MMAKVFLTSAHSFKDNKAQLRNFLSDKVHEKLDLVEDEVFMHEDLEKKRILLFFLNAINLDTVHPHRRGFSGRFHRRHANITTFPRSLPSLHGAEIDADFFTIRTMASASEAMEMRHQNCHLLGTTIVVPVPLPAHVNSL